MYVTVTLDLMRLRKFISALLEQDSELHKVVRYQIKTILLEQKQAVLTR